MRKINILMVCGAGLGSSFACQMSTEDVLKELKVEAKLDHSDITSASSLPADIIMTAENFRTQFAKFSIDTNKTTIIFLRNIVDKREIADKLVPVLKEKGVI